MRATIRDHEALRSVRPTDLMTYLRSTGWHLTDQSNKAAYWEKASESDTANFEVLVPLRTEFGDFITRIAEILETLEVVETRSQLEIFNELITTSADVIRIQTHSRAGEDQGSLALEDGVIAYEKVREMILAAACATVTRRALFAKRKPELAMSYLRKVRLGQTERGSYVFTLISPVTPALRATSEDLIPAEEPFERRVVELLANALTATRDAAVASAVLGGDMAPFKNAIVHGVSANLFEAISGLSEASGNKPIEVRFSWARSRQPVANVPNRIGLTQDIFPAVKEAARVFRATEPQPDFELLGSVIALRREEGQTQGTITVLTTIGKHVKRVLVDLADENYNLAVRAHEERALILSYGDLEREGRNFRLKNPHDLMVFPNSGDDDDYVEIDPLFE